MQSWKDMSRRWKVALGAVVIALLAAGGAFAADRLGDDEPAQKPTRVQEKPGDDVRPTGKRLDLGEFAKISPNYSVAVTELTLYEGEDTQLLAATVRAENIGTEPGEPWADLSVEYVEANGWTAAETSCPSGLDDGSDDPLAVGDVTTHVACMAVRSKNLKGGRVYVEEALADGKRVAWTTDEVVTEALPSPEPDAPGGQGPAAEFRPPSGGGNSASTREVCEEYEDDVEEYHDGIGELNEIAERNKDNPKYEDEIEDFEEWKDTMEANIDRYEELC